MEVGFVNSFSSLSGGRAAVQGAKINGEKAKFSDLVQNLSGKNGGGTLSSSQVVKNGRLNGEYTSGFSGSFSNPNDKTSLPKGAASNQANSHVIQDKIDRSSVLYEKSMELESYFVKEMLSSMRKTVSKSALFSEDFAGKMYEDMLFDEYAASMTKNAGFGLADQIYLSLKDK